MEKVVPVLQIDDGDMAKAFYLDKLGFELDFEWRHEPGFPVFMGIKRGELDLHLSEHGKGHPGSEIYIFVDDVHEWYERITAGGITPTNGPEPKPWGNTEMLITDPHRNSLRISQIGTHEPTSKSS